jgi:hypothetical protein
MNPRAMKHAMKSAPLIGQINQHTAEEIVKFPRFLECPRQDSNLRRPA